MAEGKPLEFPDWLFTKRETPEISVGHAVDGKPAPVTESEALMLMEAIISVCRDHGLWLSHEDGHGGFLVQRGTTENWLRSARPSRFETPDALLLDENDDE